MNTENRESPTSSNTRLASLLRLVQAARRAASLNELWFVAVNGTHDLLPYQRGVIYDISRKQVVAISGAPFVNDFAPEVVAVTEVCRKVLTLKEFKGSPRVLPGAEKLPNGALLIPLIPPHEELIGVLMLERGNPWSDADKTIAAFLGETYAYAWKCLTHGRSGFMFIRSFLMRLLRPMPILIVIISILLCPVHESAMGQAEVVATDAAVIRSPLDGIISEVFVTPDAMVAEGQILARLDVRALSDRLIQVEKAYELEQVRLLRNEQMMLGDSRYAVSQAELRASVAEKKAEVAYVKGLLAKAELRAPCDGVALFVDRMELIGRPVHTGERIMQVARPEESHVRFWIPAGDAVQANTGSEVTVFLNAFPEHHWRATLSRRAFLAEPRPEGITAYRMDADFVPGTSKPRIGLRGVAKIYGRRTTLAWNVFRRPVAVVRQWLGW